VLAALAHNLNVEALRIPPRALHINGASATACTPPTSRGPYQTNSNRTIDASMQFSALQQRAPQFAP
jgi:hypothetical protein